jgi:proline iminopeptidase
VSALARYLAFRRTLPPRPPLEHRMVRARGLDFAVYTTPVISDASPLLCINGGLLFDHTLLWPALAPLALHRQLIFYDQRGRGASDTPPGLHASRIEFDAGDVPALRAALGIDEWDLLGHSWGGGIAMLAAAQENAAATGGVRKLVLVNAVGATSDWLPPLHAAGLARLTGDARARLAACDVRQLERPELGVHADYAQAFFPAWFADADLARSVAPPRGDSVTGAHVAARLRRDGYDWIDRPRSVAERTAQFLARAHLVPIPEAGHNPFWEAPDAFFAAVHTFLAEGVPAS